MERLIKQFPVHIDEFSMPIIGTYELLEDTPLSRIKARRILYDYEDTGLTPEEVAELKRDIKIAKQVISQYEDTVEWMFKEIEEHRTEAAELSQAKAEGRLVVLPCKVGDTVYYLREQYAGKTNAVPCTVSSIAYDGRWARVYGIEERQNTQMWYFDDFGKTVFLTKEEAEAALKERENNA